MAIGMGKNLDHPVDFEDALAVVGTGRFHQKLVLVGGFALFCSYIAISGISFVLPSSQCDLKMSSQDKGNLISASFLGIALSCHFWGFLSDTLGRHYIISRCLFADGLLYIITSLTPSYPVILFWRFCNGFASCGATVSLYAYIGEFHPNESRLKSLLIVSFLGSLSYCLLPAFAWLIIPGTWSFTLYPGLIYRSWRLYYASNGIPSLLCSFILYFFPESPKFLLAHGEQSKTLEIMQRIYKENSRSKNQEDFMIKTIVLNKSEISVKPEYNSNKATAFFRLVWYQTIPLFKPPLVLCIVLVCLTQYLLYFSNGGILLWLPETLNRLAVFKNDFGMTSATYCNVVEYKRQALQNNKSVGNVFITTNSLVLNNTLNDNNNNTQLMLLPNVSYQEPLCTDDVDLNVYLNLEILGISSSAALAICIGITSVVDKKYLIEFLIFVSLLCNIILLKINVTQMIPVFASLIVVISGISIPIINSLAVDLFPTNMRAMAGCFILMWCRLGTVSANALSGIFIDSQCSLLLWCFITAFTVSLILIALLPKKPPYLEEVKKSNEY